MCGFAGFIDRQSPADRRTAVAREMADALRHRGPDDEGVWSCDQGGVALAFRRLSILDLSPAGHQPMASACGRYRLVFNGEIYNAEDLRLELGPRGWRGHSDTEVLLAALAEWGTDATLARLDGMFAFALWDLGERRLTLARDRFGEKPLYWGHANRVLLFGSELKALACHPAFDPALDGDALGAYLRWGWIPQPHSPYRAINALPPGTRLVIEDDGTQNLAPYWSARTAAERAAPFQGGFDEAVDEMERRLAASVARRLRADVPVAVFLSGGIDSSLLAGFAAERTPHLKSFTIAFGAEGCDESAHAGVIAAHLGLDHTALEVGEAEALALIPDLPGMLDAPLGDPAALPLALLARLAAKDVTVALSGDGADELFGGYGTHVGVAARWPGLSGVPGRFALAALLGTLPMEAIDRAAVALSDAVGRRRRSHPGLRLGKLTRDLAAPAPAALLGNLRSLWRGGPPRVAGAKPFPTRFDDPFTLADAASEAMLTDALTYLPDDLCVKTDRVTMWASLEARLPFLDHTLAEFAWSLPVGYKLDQTTGKRVLRALLARRLPGADRPKQGLEVPVGRWIKGSLKDWAGDLLSPARLARQGLLDPAPVAMAWEEHQSGRKDWSGELWTALMLQAWLDKTAVIACGDRIDAIRP